MRDQNVVRRFCRQRREIHALVEMRQDRPLCATMVSEGQGHFEACMRWMRLATQAVRDQDINVVKQIEHRRRDLTEVCRVSY